MTKDQTKGRQVNGARDTDMGIDRTPAELRGVESLLDRLGAAERSSADAALEARLAAAAQREASALRLVPGPRAARRSIIPLMTNMRLAAVIALAGAVLAVLLSSRGVTTGGTSPAGGGGVAASQSGTGLLADFSDEELDLAFAAKESSVWSVLERDVDLLSSDTEQLGSRFGSGIESEEGALQ